MRAVHSPPLYYTLGELETSVRGWRSEDRGWRTEVGGQRSEDRGQRSVSSEHSSTSRPFWADPKARPWGALQSAQHALQRVTRNS